MRSIIKCPYYYFDSVLTDELCDSIITQGKEKTQEEAYVISSSNQLLNDLAATTDIVSNAFEKIQTLDKSYRRGKVAWLEEEGISNILNAYVERANKDANWNFILDNKERIQFATYGKQDFYDYHRDCGIVAPFYRKLSITVQLSNPNEYEGGDFKMKHLWGNKDLPMDPETKNRGTIIVFPSMIPHTVAPVTKGKRYSLVQWYSGPDFV